MRIMPLIAAALTALVLLQPAQADFWGDLGLGGARFKQFKGKFFDTDAVKNAHANEAATEATMRGFGENGHSLGAIDWDAIPTPVLKAYGNRIMDKLLAAWDGPHPKMHLWITADPGLSAESTGTGDLFIARGWFDQVDSEDEIAAIIAHEVSHVLLNHFGRDEANEDRNRAVGSAAGVATTAFALSSLRVQGTGTSAVVTQDSTKVHNQVRKALLLKFAVDEFSSYTLNAPWARAQENEADLLGTDLMYRAKYNTEAMKSALERLKSYETAAAQQIDQITSQYDDTIKNDLAHGDMNDLKSTFQEIAGNLALQKGEDLRSRLTRNHPDTQSRIDDIKQYIGREYADDPGPALQKNAFHQFVSGKEVKTALDDHSLSVKANSLLTQGDRAQARAQAQRGLAHSGNAPYPLHVMGLVLQQSGDTAHGLDYLKRAAASPDASFSTVMLLAGQYAAAKRFKEAHATLARAIQRFGSEEATYPTQITLALGEGNRGEAKRVYDGCLKVENSDLVQECRTANGDTCTSSQLLCAFKDRASNVPDFLGNLFGK